MATKNCPHCGAKLFGLVSRCYRCKKEIKLPEKMLENIQSKPLSTEGGHSSGTHVTDCRYWRCPSCDVMLEKPSLGALIHPGENIATIMGTARCPRCNTEVSQSQVYGGRYDVQAATPTVSATGSSNCTCCRRNIYPSSAFDLSNTEARIAATQGGLGFQCTACSRTYCAPCLSSAPQHPRTGGRACPSCGGAMEMWTGSTTTAAMKPSESTQSPNHTATCAGQSEKAGSEDTENTRQPAKTVRGYRCPRCGATFPELDWRCPECYFEFEDIELSSPPAAVKASTKDRVTERINTFIRENGSQPAFSKEDKENLWSCLTVILVFLFFIVLLTIARIFLFSKQVL